MYEPKNKVDKDSFRTPQYIFDWLNSKYNFDINLASDQNNKLCAESYDKKYDALSAIWFDPEFDILVGFCNPPYSKINPWIEKAIDEAKFGFTTVFLIPDFNGEEMFDLISRHATTIIHLIGRVSFLSPCDHIVKVKNKPDKLIKEGDEMTGNNRGSCVVEFSKRYWDIPPVHLYANTKDIKAEFEK